MKTHTLSIDRKRIIDKEKSEIIKFYFLMYDSLYIQYGFKRYKYDFQLKFNISLFLFLEKIKTLGYIIRTEIGDIYLIQAVIESESIYYDKIYVDEFDILFGVRQSPYQGDLTITEFSFEVKIYYI